MATQSLLDYLSIPLPDISTQHEFNFRNTTNSRYGSDDIIQVVAWPQFNYAAIIHKYGPALNAKRFNPDHFSSLPPAIRDESQFQLRFAELILPQIRRSLRAALEQLAPELQLRQLSAVMLDGGGSAAIIDQYRRRL